MSFLKSISFLLLSSLTLYLSYILKPNEYLAELRPIGSIELIIPNQFSDWVVVENQHLSVINPVQEVKLSEIYSQLLTRTYINAQGKSVMLSISYGEHQANGLALHYPEACYPAQGFDVVTNKISVLQTAFGDLEVRKLETLFGNDRYEPVTYWTIIGDYVTVSSFEKRMIELQYGLQGVIPDGLLFRVSSIDSNSNSDEMFKLHSEFISSLLNSIAPNERYKLIGKSLDGSSIQL